MQCAQNSVRFFSDFHWASALLSELYAPVGLRQSSHLPVK